jgi:hypothetical protein
LFQTIEELHGVAKKTRQIYQLVTCGSREFHAKYEKSVTLNEYHELYCMSNVVSASLHVFAEDRRIVIWAVNPVLKGNTKFWDAFNAELKDLDVLHAIYTWLKNMDLTGFDPKKLHPKLVHTKQEVVQDQQQKSHSFIAFLMDKHDWHGYGREQDFKGTKDPRWYDGFKFYFDFKQKKERYMCRIDQDTLYKQYKFYIKNKCTGKFRQATTFFKEIGEIGVTVYDKAARLNKRMRKFVDIEYSKVNSAWNKVYGVDCNPFAFNKRSYAIKTARFFNHGCVTEEPESEVDSDSE